MTRKTRQNRRKTNANMIKIDLRCKFATYDNSVIYCNRVCLLVMSDLDINNRSFEYGIMYQYHIVNWHFQKYVVMLNSVVAI